MAPRGGGGHGGGGGGHSSGSGGSGGSSSSSSPSNWSQHMMLSGGNRFHDALETVALAIVCLALISMLVIAAWSCTIKNHRRLSMRFFGLPLGLFATIAYFSLDVADRVLKEYDTIVRDSYVFLYVAQELFKLLAEVVVLAIVYTIVQNRQTALWKEVAGTGKFKFWRLAQTVVLLTLTGIMLADSIMFLMYYVSFLAATPGQVSSSAIAWIGRYRNVHAAFYILYLVATVDIMIATLLIWRAASKNKHLTATASKIPKFLLFIIMPMLVLRALVSAIYAVNYSLLHHAVPAAANLAAVIFYALPTIAIFVGIILVAKQSDWSAEYSAVSQGGEAGAYGTNTAYAGAAKPDPNVQRASWTSNVPPPPQYAQPQPSPGLYNPPAPVMGGAYVPPPPPPPAGASAGYYNGYRGATSPPPHGREV